MYLPLLAVATKSFNALMSYPFNSGNLESKVASSEYFPLLAVATKSFNDCLKSGIINYFILFYLMLPPKFVVPPVFCVGVVGFEKGNGNVFVLLGGN